MGRWLGALVLVACSACGGGEDDPDAGTRPDVLARPDAHVEITGCPGERPADIDGCFRGDDFADCGGTDRPYFACLPSGFGCTWFAGGCVPTSHIASPCPPENVCCIDEWPFERGVFPDFTAVANVWGSVFHIGRIPLDSTRAARVSVVVDPSLTTLASPTMVCTGDIALCPPPPGRGDPLEPMASADARDDTLTVAGFYEWRWEYLYAEVLPTEPVSARACIREVTDVRGGDDCDGDPVIVDPEADPWLCADSGVLTVSEIPAARSGEADIAFRLEADFGAMGTVTLTR